jgi:hypothetical protein
VAGAAQFPPRLGGELSRAWSARALDRLGSVFKLARTLLLALSGPTRWALSGPLLTLSRHSGERLNADGR